MSHIIPSAASQQDAPPGGALNHLAPVVDLLARSAAKSKFQQGAGARRWLMVATLVRRAFTGAKSLLTLIGAVAVGGLLLLPLHGEALQKLSILAVEPFFEPATVVAGPIQAREE